MADATKFLDKEQYEIALARIKAFNEATYLRLSGGTLTGDINLATNTKAIVLATASSWASSDRAIPFSANGEPSKMTYYLDNADTGLTFNPNTGALKAASFVKRGGTSSQFLKADGSVDTTAYLYGTTNQSITRSVSSEAETWSNLGYDDADKGKFNLKIVRHSSGVKNSFGGTGMNYGNTIFFGGADTRAYMGVAYSAPRVVFGGGSLGATSASSAPEWYMILTGTDATTYNLTTIASEAANGNSAYNSLSSYLPLAGGTMTGAIMLSDNNAARIRKDWIGNDTTVALLGNYSGAGSSGFARNILGLAVDDTICFRIGMYGQYTLGASDNKPSYIYLGQYGYNGLNLRIGMDDTIKWGTNDIWHEGNDEPLTPSGPYHNYTNGYLVTTNINGKATHFPIFKIEGRNHNNNTYYPIISYIQSYTYSSGISANSSRGIHMGHPLGDVYLFLNSDNKLCLWFAQPLSNDTFWITAYNRSRKNIITSVTNAAIPEGVTTVTVVFKTNARLDSNVASATALETARTLWGQSFDGTGNVSGQMSSVGNILSLTTDTYTIGSTTNKWKNIYANSATLDGGATCGGSSTGAYIGSAAGGLGSSYTGALVLAYKENPIRFYTNSANRMIINSSGSVGIGTDSPSYKLHVNGSGYFVSPVYMASNAYVMGDVIDLNRNGNSGAITTASKYAMEMVAATNGINFNIYSPSNGAAQGSVMTLASGRVGVGVTSPEYDLHVDGDTYSTTGFKVPNAISYSGIDTGNTARGLLKLDSDILFLGHGSSAANYPTYIEGGSMIRFRIGTSYATVGTWTATGLGIGVTSPNLRLQITSSHYSYVQTGFDGSNVLFRKLSTNSTGFVQALRFIRHDEENTVVENVALLGVYSTDAYSATFIAGSAYNNSAIRIQGSGTSAKVGIGLADAATYKLQVGGNVKANGFYADGEDGYYNANGSGTYYKNMYMTSAGSLILGYGHAQAGGLTYLSGNQVIFRYGTTPTEGMRINASGNVGIGTTSPSYKLHVSGTFCATGASRVKTLLITSTAAENHINFSRVGANYINFPVSTSSANSTLYFSTGGYSAANTILALLNNTSQEKRVGILNTSPSYTLDVTGVIHSTTGIFSDGYVSAYGVASSSDARLKDGISAISYGRAKEVLSALNPSEWTWKKDGRRGAGMVAQEVQPVLPDTVSEIGGNLTLEYNTAFAYGLAATKYMLPMVESHEEKIARLEKEVEDLRKELKHFKN